MTFPNQFFIHYLNQLEVLLTNIYPNTYLFTEKIIEDSFPLSQHATTCISFSLRCCCTLLGRDTISFNTGNKYHQIISEIKKTISYLARIDESEWNLYQTKLIKFKAGFSTHEIIGDEFYQLYSAPNFIFHYTQVYSILRYKGIEIGKKDFDGFHAYPKGFSFN